MPSAGEGGAPHISFGTEACSQVPEVFDYFDVVAYLVPPSFPQPFGGGGCTGKVIAFVWCYPRSHNLQVLASKVESSGEDAQHGPSLGDDEDVVGKDNASNTNLPHEQDPWSHDERATIIIEKGHPCGMTHFFS